TAFGQFARNLCAGRRRLGRVTHAVPRLWLCRLPPTPVPRRRGGIGNALEDRRVLVRGAANLAVLGGDDRFTRLARLRDRQRRKAGEQPRRPRQGEQRPPSATGHCSSPSVCPLVGSLVGALESTAEEAPPDTCIGGQPDQRKLHGTGLTCIFGGRLRQQRPTTPPTHIR